MEVANNLTPHEQTIWLAAILEGEGSFSVVHDKRPNRRPRLVVSLQMIDYDVIEKVSSLVAGTTKVRKVSRPSRPQDTDCYSIQWNGQIAEDLMRRVFPFMGSRRKARIVDCLSQKVLSHHAIV